MDRLTAGIGERNGNSESQRARRTATAVQGKRQTAEDAENDDGGRHGRGQRPGGDVAPPLQTTTSEDLADRVLDHLEILDAILANRQRTSPLAYALYEVRRLIGESPRPPGDRRG